MAIKQILGGGSTYIDENDALLAVNATVSGRLSAQVTGKTVAVSDNQSTWTSTGITLTTTASAFIFMCKMDGTLGLGTSVIAVTYDGTTMTKNVLSQQFPAGYPAGTNAQNFRVSGGVLQVQCVAAYSGTCTWYLLGAVY